MKALLNIATFCFIACWVANHPEHIIYMASEIKSMLSEILSCCLGFIK